MLIATTVLATAVAVQVLRDHLSDVAEVRDVPLPKGRAARLDTTGERPVLWLSSTASAKAQARALLDVMRVLTLGLPPEHARQAPRLHSVN